MRCPFCGGPTRVVDTIKDPLRVRVVRRRRQCKACQRRFSTEERHVITGRI
jgi:transcriptional regulator NrdR family protein